MNGGSAENAGAVFCPYILCIIKKPRGEMAAGLVDSALGESTMSCGGRRLGLTTAYSL
jgi:hypothetical protein